MPLGSARAADTDLLPTPAGITRICTALSRITGLSWRKPPVFQIISRDETNRYLDQRWRDSGDERELALEEIALKLFGLIPQNYPLRQSALALMTEQAAAFYDYHLRKLFLANWTPVSLRDTAVVHELAHALADEHYHLERFSRAVQRDSEKSAARQAVIEGQASYLALLEGAEEDGTPLTGFTPDPALLDRTVEPSGEYSEFDHAPLYVRMSLVFPYTSGLAFQAAVINRMGKDGYTEVFHHPPVSTSEVLHPDLYFAGKRKASVRLPGTPRAFKTVMEGEFGELDHRALIQTYAAAAEARRLSPSLRGSRFRILRAKDDGLPLLLYGSEWATEDAARDFLRIYRQCLAGKWKHMRVQKETPDAFSGQSETGWFRVFCRGRRVQAEEGWPEPL